MSGADWLSRRGPLVLLRRLPLADWDRLRHHGAPVGTIWSYRRLSRPMIPSDTAITGQCSTADSYLCSRRLIFSEESVFISCGVQIPCPVSLHARGSVRPLAAVYLNLSVLGDARLALDVWKIDGYPLAAGPEPEAFLCVRRLAGRV